MSATCWSDGLPCPRQIPAADHAPSPATDGLREAIEALADEARARKAAYPSHPHWSAWDHYESDLRDALAAHPAPPIETAPVLDGPSFGDYWPPSETATEPVQADRDMRAFVAGWFAHARNREGLVVEDAWRAYLEGSER